MHPAIARFVPQSASDTMSSFASQFASLARSKLRSAYTGGSRDNLSLHRWVLLKNSITTQDVHTNLDARGEALVSNATSHKYEVEAEEADFEDEEVDSIIDEGVFAFLFPDPGDAVATPEDDASASEEQWLDSLLETLGDEDDSDDDPDIKVCILPVDSDSDSDAEQLEPHSRADDESLCTSCSEEFATSPIAVPYPVPYPPFHPPLVRPFEIDSHDCFFTSHSSPYSPYHLELEDLESPVPDAIEDTSDDESESLSTPFSRSRSSLNLVDPALIPLPRDRYEPHIYSASDAFFPYEVDSLPHSDFNSDSTPVYSPYHQAC